MQKLLRSKFFSAFALVAVFWLGASALDTALQKRHIERELGEIESKIAGLERENQFLGRSTEYFKSESFMERQARVKLNYKMQGEQVVFVYPSSGSGQVQTFEDELRKMANYKKWWYYLLGY